MTLDIEKCISQIDRYLNKEDYRPRLVNVETVEALQKLINHYHVGANKFLSVTDFSKSDEMLNTADFLAALEKYSSCVFLTGFTTWWKLRSEDELLEHISALAMSTYKAHVVLLCFQCRKYIPRLDHRVDVYDVVGEATEHKPKITFINPRFTMEFNADTVHGIENLPAAIEKNNGGNITVATNMTKASFPNSQYDIVVESNIYDLLCQKDSRTGMLSQELGTEEQWSYVLTLMGKNGSWETVLKQVVGNSSHLELYIQSWNQMDDAAKWVYFMGMKLFKTVDNQCLCDAMDRADSPSKLPYCILRSLLDYDPKEAVFWSFYDMRKKLMAAVEVPDNELLEYCSLLKSKKERAVYYLTDLTQLEKETLFEILSDYHEEFEPDTLSEALKHTYSDLYDYLKPYQFKSDLLSVYFDLYKFCKVTNHVTPEFEILMEDQAEKREFKRLLPTRSSKLEAINMDGAKAYFMDAMGVEFLGYILEKCRQKDLIAKVTVCRSELPSLTYFNKDFEEVFNANGVPLTKIDDLDNIKHHGSENFTLENSPYPIHLIRELEIINHVLNMVRNSIVMGKCERYILVADHGASRLAMIYQDSQIIDANEKGIHGGRVCACGEELTDVPCAAVTDDYYVIANYDRFKGGHKTGVEIHGGATLEEVTVPIIEISFKPKNIEVAVQTPIVQASFKHPPVITFYINTKTDNLSVHIGANCYEVQYIDAHTFKIEMPKRTKAQKYTADIYIGDSLAVSDLSFEVEKEGMQTNNMGLGL